MDKFVRRLPSKPNITKKVGAETQPSTSTIPATQGVTPSSSHIKSSFKPDSNPKPSSKTVSTNEGTKTRWAEQEHPATSSTATTEAVQLDIIEPPAKLETDKHIQR
ncbi:hypothetical protein O0L34_g3185 [Tuta absoluta]|nr:hypothetical protein O0L34_g3185 [Tuta absoluta]